ncbi:MAG: prepilin-type N-terminal cleavage/methylation domain-containing protein, partial [Planctomycetota bacterium]|nr:prepilin-type N-terminal cleavage/methylation domain-containing protein [Planctomycetota bacterium]
MRDRSAFTLIELLVVIAIIALLLSIIMPALSVAKQQATGAVCLANMSGLSKAWCIYADENKDRMIGGTTSLNPTDSWGGGYLAYSWVCSPQTQTGQSKSDGSTVEEEMIGVRKGLLYPYVGADDTYHCPGDRRYTKPPAYPGYGGVGGYRSYSIAGGMNGVSPAGDWNIVPHTMRSRIKSPGDKYVFIEEMDGRGYNMGSWVIWPKEINNEQWIDPISIWHNEKSNLGFADGHAEKHNWRDKITVEMAKSQIFYVSAPGSEDLRYMQR